MSNLNLCEILKVCQKGDNFWSPTFGVITFLQIDNNRNIQFRVPNDTNCIIIFYSNGLYISGGVCQVFPSRSLYEKYPLDAKQAWMEWQEEQKPKIPKTWRDIEDYIGFNNRNDYCIDVTGNFTRRNSLIEKSALALLKIHQLIEVGYGGNVTDEEWRNDEMRKWYFVPNQSYSPNNGNEMWDITFLKAYYAKRPFAFHTKEQAEEFLSYSENVQLLRDYFMI